LLDANDVTHFAYYVYYRIAPAASAQARDAVRKAQFEVADATGAAARLLVGHGEPDLWMEVYEDVTDTSAFELALAGAVERYQLSTLLAGGAQRKVEIFVDARCA
jgi:hypothetical protein